MCKKLQGNENGLIGCWNFDQSSRNVLPDLSNSLIDGNLTNFINNTWEVSGAAIADESVFTYSDLTNAELSLNTLDGIIKTENLSSNIGGVQLFKINSLPVNTSGIFDLGNTQSYFGVFPSYDNLINYDINFDYSQNINALASPDYLKIYSRTNAQDNLWLNSFAINSISDSKLNLSNNLSQEFIMADFSENPCVSSSNIQINNITVSSATISFVCGNSFETSIIWGFPRFNLLQGNLISNINSPYTLTGLDGDTEYQFYIKDSCEGFNPIFIGPFNFYSEYPCPAPTSLGSQNINNISAEVNWNGSADSYNVQCGLEGYEFGTGLIANTSINNILLQNLMPSTTYDVYVRSRCNGEPGLWSEKHQFTTEEENFSINELTILSIVIYPNPVSKYLFIELDGVINELNYIIMDITGKTLKKGNIGGSLLEIDLSNFNSGIYTIQFELKDEQRKIFKLIKL